jgi:predicted dehydrogenase
VKKIRVALVGAGSMANTYHYPSLSDFTDVELVGICDLVEEKLKVTADRFGIEGRFASYQEMVESTSPDAVYILMPPHHLLDIVMYCLARKMHVFIEKPPGVSTYQARAMALAAEENGCLTMVGFDRRFMPVVQQAKKIVEERGPVSRCIATFYKNAVNEGMYYGGAVDILYCDAVHAVDMLRFMAGGEVVKVVSSIRSLYKPYPNSWQALVEFDTGCIGVLLTDWTSGGRVHTFEMHGKGISAFLDWDNPGRILADDNKDPVWIRTPAEAAGDESPGKMYGFYQENRYFIDCLQEGKQPITNFADAVKTMELVDHIYKNAI